MASQDPETHAERTFTLPKTSPVTQEVIRQLDHILEFAPPEAYRNTLIEIYHIYIYHEHELLPHNFDEMADHMYFLIDFLKVVGEEMRGQ